MVYLRQKEDPWKSIAAGAATGGFLQLRAGPRSATRSAIFGGVLLAFIEGAGLMLNRVMTQPPPIEDPVPQVTGPPTGIFLFRTPNTAGIPGASGIPGAWFGSWYGGGKKEEPKTYNEKLDNFDANPAPLFQVSRSNKRA